MNHRRWIEFIELSYAGELEESAQQRLADHLVSCAACRKEAERVGRLYGILATQAKEPDENLLREAREELHGLLRAMPRPRPAARRAFAWFEFFHMPGIRFGLVGAGSFALGIILAVVLYGRSGESSRRPVSELSNSRAGETRIANVRFLQNDTASGEVEFTFDAVRPVKMKGRVEDEQIQRVLTQAVLNEENPGVRLQSVSALSETPSPEREVKSALIEAMKHDQNAGVRKEALRALRHYPFDNDIKGGLIYLLGHETNPGLRITVIDLLDTLLMSRQGADKDILQALKSRIQQDDNNYIRLHAKAVVEEIRK